MKKLFVLVVFFAGFITSGFTYKSQSDVVKDYLGVPGPITYDNVQYVLSASYHPSDAYYKQEYVPAGENIDRYNKMVFIDAYITDMTPKDVVSKKIAELEERKKTDPVVQYRVIQNDETGEYLLDFVLSDANGDKISVAEWNGYIYKSFTSSTGKKGVLIFALSVRGYDDHIKDFLTNLKTDKGYYIKAITSYKVPKTIFEQ